MCLEKQRTSQLMQGKSHEDEINLLHNFGIALFKTWKFAYIETRNDSPDSRNKRNLLGPLIQVKRMSYMTKCWFIAVLVGQNIYWRLYVLKKLVLLSCFCDEPSILVFVFLVGTVQDCILHFIICCCFCFLRPFISFSFYQSRNLYGEASAICSIYSPLRTICYPCFFSQPGQEIVTTAHMASLLHKKKYVLLALKFNTSQCRWMRRFHHKGSNVSAFVCIFDLSRCAFLFADLLSEGKLSSAL